MISYVQQYDTYFACPPPPPSYRSGSITVDELKAVCAELGTPITEKEIASLLKE